jgi:hypothetical protein
LRSNAWRKVVSNCSGKIHAIRRCTLYFKKVGRFWSVRVGLHYRALAVEDGADLVWFWIGPHAEYDRILGRG